MGRVGECKVQPTINSTQMDTIAIMIVTTSPTINIETQTTNISPVVIEASTQTMHCPRQKETATQTEPLDNDHFHLSEGIKILMKPWVSPTIIEDPQPEPQVSCSALLHDELVKTLEQQPMPPVQEPSPHFNWAKDAESLPIASRLVDLSRVLQALGWAPMC